MPRGKPASGVRSDQGSRRSEYITRVCDSPSCIKGPEGGRGIIQRRASDLREKAYCDRECFHESGASYAGKKGGGRPPGPNALRIMCPDGIERGAVPQDGYVNVYWPDHPNANKAKRVGLHVAVMAHHLGRPLVKGETPHHRNGVRDDNRIENLDLWFRGQPAGQRVDDLVLWAVDVLARYAPDWLAQQG